MIYHQFQEAAVTNSIVLEAKSLKTFPNLFYGLYRFSLCQHSLYLTHEVLAKTIHNPIHVDTFREVAKHTIRDMEIAKI